MGPPYREATSSPLVSPPEAWLVTGITMVLAYPVWFRGATYRPGPGSLLTAGIALLGMLLLTTLASRGEEKSASALTGLFRRLWRDPVLYLGIGFVALLWLQWWNAGRVEIFDPARQEWTYSLPHHPGWPSAITRPESAEMLGWFFPAWVLVLSVRSGRLGRNAVRLLLGLALVNASALVLVGLWTYMPVRIEPGHGRQLLGFATFSYRNHAGAFFSLLLLLALGFLLHECVGRGQRRKRWGHISLAGLAAGLMLVGANLSLSRAGMMSWGAVFLALLYGMGASWPRLDPSARFRTMMACAGAVAVCFFLIDGLGSRELTKRVNELVHVRPEAELVERRFQARAAVRMWMDHPWFGVGGWGYRYWVGHYVDPEFRRRLGVGKANVHNDPLQFLAEFGLIGGGALAGTALWLLKPLLRVKLRAQPMVLFPLIGIGGTYMHSLIDLPFRSPPILWHWAVILAALPLMAAPREQPGGMCVKPVAAGMKRVG